MTGKSFYVRNRGKVTGPFDLQQLKFLRDRGQLARFHEVSEDRRSWVQAASMMDLFPTGAGAATLSALASGAGNAAGNGWLYVDQSGNQQGPVGLEQLADLRRSDAIGDATLVWKEGMAEWLPLKSASPDLPNVGNQSTAGQARSRRWLLAVAGSLFAVAVAVAGTLYWSGALGGKPTDGGSTPSIFGSNTISNLGNESDIAGAVGFVVCGAHMVYPDGSQGDAAFGTGTAFLISANGHLATNRHVVQEIGNLMNAQLLLKKLRDESLLDVKPMIWVFFGKQKYVATILYQSENYDLAILKIDRQHTPYFKLASSDSLARGLRIITCGYPAAAQAPLTTDEALRKMSRDAVNALPKTKIEAVFSPRDFEYIRTEGTISRVTTEDGNARRWIQHTASINPGNSGGPLLDEKGRVIGINTLGVMKAGVSGIFFSLATPQLKDEIAKHVPGAVWE